MTKFIFDLDGTITQEETLPLISRNFDVQNEIDSLTDETIKGNIPFIESFIRRVYILGKLPVSEIADLLENVKLYESVIDFIIQHRDDCSIATGNLSCWIEKLNRRIGCTCYCSDAVVRDNKVDKLTKILRKEEIVKKYQLEGNRVVFIGDGNNDLEAMRLADVAVASGLTHPPASSILSVADYLVYDEVALCRLLNQLL